MRFYLLLIFVQFIQCLTLAQEETLEEIFDEGIKPVLEVNIGTDLMRTIGGVPHVELGIGRYTGAVLFNMEAGIIPFGYSLTQNSPIFYDNQVGFGRELSTSVLFRIFEYSFYGSFFGDVRFNIGIEYENWRYSTRNMEIGERMLGLYIGDNNGSLLNNKYLFTVANNYDFSFDRRYNIIGVVMGAEQHFANRHAYDMHVHFGIGQNEIKINHLKTSGVEWIGDRPDDWYQPSFIGYFANVRMSITYKFKLKK